MSTRQHRFGLVALVLVGVTGFAAGAATSWAAGVVRGQLEDVYVERVCSPGEEPVWHTGNTSGTACTRNGRVPEGYARFPAGRVPTWDIAPDDQQGAERGYDVHPNQPHYRYLDDLLTTYPERSCTGQRLRTLQRVPVGPGTLRASVNPAGDLCLRLTAPDSARTEIVARQAGERWRQHGGAEPAPLRVGGRGLVRVTAAVRMERDGRAEMFTARLRVGNISHAASSVRRVKVLRSTTLGGPSSCTHAPEAQHS